MTGFEGSAKLTAVRDLVTVATQRLLGDTIGVDDDGWRAASRLPRWSRGHVATHVARQADALVRLTEWARTGQRRDMYDSLQAREEQIEAGADRPGLELQIDLDTSAGRLTDAFAALDETSAWDAEVELRGGLRVVARLLPLARLIEVVLHHVDLDVGFGVEDIDAETAEWLLEWAAYRLGAREEFPRLHLSSDSGLDLTLGSAGQPRTVHGTPAALLGWLTGRAGPDTVTGTDGLVLPGL